MRLSDEYERMTALLFQAVLSGKWHCVYLTGARDMQRRIGNVSFFYGREIRLLYFDKNQICNYLAGSSFISVQDNL